MAIQQQNAASAPRRTPSRPAAVTQHRSALLYFLLSAVTLSVYHFWFMHRWVRDLNIICEGDGKKTLGVGEALLLGIPTLGIYPLVWLAGIMDRMYNNAERYDAPVYRDGESFYLWVMLLPVAGAVVAMALAIRDMNRLTEGYLANRDTAAAQAKAAEPAAKPRTGKPAPAPLQEKQGGLCGLTGCCAGTKIPLRPGEKIRLGRDAEHVSVVVTGGKVSRVHCTVQYYGERLGYSIVDRSRNGVLLNGKRIHREQPTYAKSGAVIALADGANKFQLL